MRSLKKSGLQRDLNPWPPRSVRCSTNWAMKPHVGSEVRFFQASHFQLLKLENLLRWSLFTSYTTAVQIWIISYILHILKSVVITFMWFSPWNNGYKCMSDLKKYTMVYHCKWPHNFVTVTCAYHFNNCIVPRT